jgi:hypothetical protein
MCTLRSAGSRILGKGMLHQKYGVPIDNNYVLKNREKDDNKV